jgi:hypothetical protein
MIHRFDALRKDPQAKAMPQRNDGARNSAVVIADEGVADENLVNFQAVNRKLAQVVQA